MVGVGKGGEWSGGICSLRPSSPWGRGWAEACGWDAPRKPEGKARRSGAQAPGLSPYPRLTHLQLNKGQRLLRPPGPLGEEQGRPSAAILLGDPVGRGLGFQAGSS